LSATAPIKEDIKDEDVPDDCVTLLRPAHAATTQVMVVKATEMDENTIVIEDVYNGRGP